MYRAIAAPIPEDASTIKNKGIIKKNKKSFVHNCPHKIQRTREQLYHLVRRGKEKGGWIPVYQQRTGITTEVKTFLPETRLVDRF